MHHPESFPGFAALYPGYRGGMRMGTMEIEIRAARMEDAEALAGLCAQLGPEASADAMRARVVALDGNPEHAVRVAVLDGRVQGWIHVAMTRALEYEPCAEILGLVVDAQARSRGLGAALVGTAEAWARARGVPELRVRSRDTRAEAHRFYQREGFALWKRQLVFRKGLAGDDALAG
jgi:GNAT superfamily N-acetyltransferase